MWTIWQEPSNCAAHWFRYNGWKWDGKLFNEQSGCGGRVARGDLFKHINSAASSTWIGTALHWDQLVLWWIWILAAHHVWPPHLMLCHFLCSPPCSCDEAGETAAARARWGFWGENLLQGKCDAEHERTGTAEHNFSACETRGWVWGSQASVDKLLGSGYLMCKVLMRGDDE